MKYDLLISATPKQNAKVSVPLFKSDIATGIIIDVNEEIVQFKIAIADLNSGFPLLNEEYNVVGIHVPTCIRYQHVWVRGIP